MKNKNSLTSKGVLWEIFNSLWILWSFFSLAWIGFFYIGKAAKQRKWTLYGCLYIVFLLVVPFVGVSPELVSQNIMDICMTIFMIAVVVSIIHSFLARKEFLIRREMVLQQRNSDNDKLRNKIQAEYIRENNSIENTSTFQNQTYVTEKNIQDNVKSTKTEEKNETTQPQELNVNENLNDNKVDIVKIDINNCTEQDLIKLPGVNTIMAKKAVLYVNENNGFSNTDEFIDYLKIKPHFAVQIQEIIVCNPPQNSKKSGRVLDF